MKSGLKIPDEWSNIVRGRAGTGVVAGFDPSSSIEPTTPTAKKHAYSSRKSTASSTAKGILPAKRNSDREPLLLRRTTTPTAAAASSPPQSNGKQTQRSPYVPSTMTSGGGGGGVGSLPPQSMTDACENILESISRADRAENVVVGVHGPRDDTSTTTNPENEHLVCLDSVLSRMPYKEMLCDLFSDKSMVAPSIPIVTRVYEENYMREPIDTTERQCVMGDSCECNMISRNDGGFIGVEFILPNERQGPNRQMCVLCHRKLVQTLFHELMYSGMPYRGVIQRYGNICGHQDEYAREIMLICPPNGPTECMPYPSVSHQRNRYRVITRNGVKYIQQLMVSQQDFQRPPRMDQQA